MDRRKGEKMPKNRRRIIEEPPRRPSTPGERARRREKLRATKPRTVYPRR